MSKIAIVVLDSVGIGALPDAEEYGDAGSNTVGNIARSVPGFDLPNLRQLGLGNIDGFDGFSPLADVEGAYGRMMLASPGKDTMTGHWEMMGIILEHAFRTFPQAFPPQLIHAFEEAIGRKTLGNEVASGTEIIARLGEQHLKTGWPIVYTSADSVFQIAAHEEVIPVDELYRMCEKARALLTGEYLVGRVIARPFVGQPGHFTRTDRRRDFALKPFRKTVLDRLVEHGLPVIGVGKIHDIFSGQGITESFHTHDNADGIRVLKELLAEREQGLIFANLVDFDMVYGHRNDVQGYARALAEFDRAVPELRARLSPDDLLVITADHGCDPTTPSTDHSREYVPLLVTGQKILHGTNLGTRKTLADLGATVAEFFRVEAPEAGRSFWREIVA